ncbi:hypothetical protein HanIR_Chr03g0122671 [Helianthus annuus]|nr:hypothetical protein HanIR_Chr03g0122671 [Helianthus annuus]
MPSEKKRVNCHICPCGLATFAILVQILNYLNLGPCGFVFVAILVQKLNLARFLNLNP